MENTNLIFTSEQKAIDDGGPMVTALRLFCVEDLPFGDATYSKR